MTHKDPSIKEWIDFLERSNHFSHAQEYAHEKSFEVFCSSDRMAMELYRKFEELGLHRTHYLQVVTGENPLSMDRLILNNGSHSSSIAALTDMTMTTAEMSIMMSSLNRSQDLTSFLRLTCTLVRSTMFIHRANDELLLEAVIPDISEARLNKPIKECLGKPIHVLNKKMADRRRSAIKEAIESRSCIHRVYDFVWESRKWDFIESYQYFPESAGGTGHIIVCVMDPDSPRGWEQRAHFYRMIEDDLAIAAPKLILDQ